MRRKLRWAVICLFVLLVAVQWYLMSVDRAANSAFADKARANNIEGQSEDSVRQLFGAPDHVYHGTDPSHDRSYHVLVYTPGPSLAFWNSECKITIDDQTKKVRAWMINSD